MSVLRGKRFRIVAVVLAILVVAFVILTVVLFVKPDLNPPERADAVVVSGGVNIRAPHEGVRLVQEGYAPTVAFSLAPGFPCVGPEVKEVDPAANVICFAPSPRPPKARLVRFSVLRGAPLATGHRRHADPAGFPGPTAHRTLLLRPGARGGCRTAGFLGLDAPDRLRMGGDGQGVGVATHLLNPKRPDCNRPATS